MDRLEPWREIEGAEMEIDERLEHWRTEMLSWEEDELTHESVAAFMRASYACGYVEGTREKGKMLLDYGYTLEGADA